VEFMTLSCVPDPPQAPKSTNRTKNSLLIKWSVPVDNGERIKNYHLEWDSGSLGSTFSLLYTGHHKQYKVLRLQPSHQYQFRVSAENVHGLSDPSFVATFHTQQSVPSTPAPPQLDKSLINALHLSWIKGGSNVIGYTLEKCDGKNEYGFLPEYDGIETKCIVKGLTPNSHYKFRLRCYNGEGTSKWSDVSSFVTCPDIPCPPSRPRVLGCVHAFSCNLAWDPPQSDGGSPVDCYILEIAAHKSMEVAYTGKLLECSLSHLTPGHSYRVRVFCVTCGGRSKPSEILEFRCPPVQPGPCEPPTITHQSKPTSISLEWASPAYNGGSEVTTYKVRYSPSIDSGVCVNLIECHGHNAVISNLKPATSYSFSLQALNCIGAGDWSEWLQVMTAANVPDQPSIPTVSKLGPTMMQLNWEHPSDNGSPITGYLLQFGKDSLLDHQLSFTSLYTLCDLTPNTSYYFSLQAINKVGKSVMSNVGDITTPPGPPSHVTKLQVSEVGSTVMVCWDTPNDRGSPITAYHVFITHGDETNTHILPPDVMSWTFDASQDTIYSIQVGSSNEVGHGELSESIKFELAPAPPVPPILSGIESSTGLKLSWVQTHKKQLLYLLQIKDKHDRFVTIYEGSSCSYRVNRLLPGTTYKFRIRASNNSGPGPFSNEFVISTRNQTSTSIQPPTISEISPTSCSLTW
uniref:Fibronectin type-III domain-containing protein n=1 Tax=Ciona savignyi TaxID=51511 RepID=H2YMM2_CIOSA